MPFKKRWNAARKIQRKWRRRRKRYPRAAGVRTGSLTIRQKEFTSIVLPAGPCPNGIYEKINFTIQGMPNLVEFQKLFDQYRINAISYTLLPCTQDPAYPSNQSLTFASSIDLDGNTAPIGSIPEMLQRANCRTTPFSAQGGLTPYKKIFLKPRWSNLLVANQNPQTDATGLGNRKQWLSLEFPNVTHHGLDLMWFNADNQLNNEIKINVIITYYMQFRKVK
jgi:hypothetical protein